MDIFLVLPLMKVYIILHLSWRLSNFIHGRSPVDKFNPPVQTICSNSSSDYSERETRFGLLVRNIVYTLPNVVRGEVGKFAFFVTDNPRASR